MNANTHTKAERRLRIVRATEKEDDWRHGSDDDGEGEGEGEREKETEVRTYSCVGRFFFVVYYSSQIGHTTILL